MSAVALRRALAVLAVLVVVWGAFALFRGSVSDAPLALQVPKLGPADVDRITITHLSDTLAFVRQPEGWSVNGFKAAAGLVDGLIGALNDAGATSEIVARRPASHARLGVDSTYGRRVRFSNGHRDIVDLVVGGEKGTFQTAYVRRFADAEVYLLRGQLPGLVSRDLDGWRDRKIAAVLADSVRSVEVERGRQRVMLVRAGGRWQVNGVPADSAAVARLLGGLADVSAIGFASVAQADSLDFVHPDRVLSVLGVGGDTLLHLLFDSTASGTWVRHAAGGAVYRLDFWRLNELTPADSALRAR